MSGRQIENESKPVTGIVRSEELIVIGIAEESKREIISDFVGEPLSIIKIRQIEETIATLQLQLDESIANLQRQVGDVDGLLLEING